MKYNIKRFFVITIASIAAVLVVIAISLQFKDATYAAEIKKYWYSFIIVPIAWLIGYRKLWIEKK